MDNDKDKDFKMLPFKMPRQGGKAFPNEGLFFEGISEYLKFEEGRRMPPMLTGLWAFLEIDQKTWDKYENGKYDDDNNNFSQIAKNARNHIITAKAQGAYVGMYNAAFAKFDLSANHNWIEKKAVDFNTNESAKLEIKQEPVTAEEALRIYQEAMKRAIVDEKDEIK